MGIDEQSANAFIGLLALVLAALVLGLAGFLLYAIGVVLIITWDAIGWWLVVIFLATIAITYVLAEIGALITQSNGPTREILNWYRSEHQQDASSGDGPDIETMEWS